MLAPTQLIVTSYANTPIININSIQYDNTSEAYLPMHLMNASSNIEHKEIFTKRRQSSANNCNNSEDIYINE